MESFHKNEYNRFKLFLRFIITVKCQEVKSISCHAFQEITCKINSDDEHNSEILKYQKGLQNIDKFGYSVPNKV